MQITEHFTLEEFERTTYKLDNKVKDPKVIGRIRDLCENVLEPIRKHFGKPVTVLSGYRCQQLNKEVKGVKNSRHLWGMAADIRIPGVTIEQIIAYVKNNLDFDEALNEFDRWAHVSYYKDHNRKKSCKIG